MYPIFHHSTVPLFHYSNTEQNELSFIYTFKTTLYDLLLDTTGVAFYN